MGASDHAPHSGRAWTYAGSGRPASYRRRYGGENHLRLRGCRGLADSVVHHQVPKRVRDLHTHRTQGAPHGGRGMPKLSIDGRQISVREGTTVIQAAEKLGIFVPRYCYHPGLSIAGNCRICLVEVEKFPKLQIACNTPVTEGMVVHTKNAKAEDGRRAVLEFLLANHPLDCPVCDQSGECDLQNFYLNFGLYDPRFREQKVKKHKAVALGPHVMLDQERCILCSRCVQFTDEITKTDRKS